MKIFFKTFGCRVNQYETEAVSERLLADGASRSVADSESADLCVVNTCTVTREADKDALRLIRRISRRNPGARLAVMGCFATRAAEAIRAVAPDAVIVHNRDKNDIPALLGRLPTASGSGTSSWYHSVGCRKAPADAGIHGFSNHRRAFVKVQDGCDMRCTYCIVPSVRPVPESRKAEQVENEVRRLVENGYQEIVLCGVRLGRYLTNGRGGKRVDFAALLARLTGLTGDFRIRLSSLEITDITGRLLDLVVRSEGKICPSFHLPLQSGSNAVLKKMRRWYSAEFYARRIAALKRKVPGAGLFTDVMAGFPGETPRDFAESKRFIEAIGFSGLHVFRYSKRDGTPAADYPEQVPDGVILARAHELRALDRELRAAFAAAAAGSRRRVLIEKNGSRVEALTDHFLRVSLDRDPGLGLRRALIEDGARAVIEDPLPGGALSATSINAFAGT